ncbi:unnamed protein product [Rotaria sordida]|uniref:Uncharacterized protein n=1 Tax=Rotaria sordida TaxID=392033 RepID=A0A819YUN7_9BILA|nr:unnamed protein product [Rotaria sordida]
MAIIVGNSKTQYAMNIQGDDTDIKINIGDTAIKASTDTAAQEVINKVGKTAGQSRVQPKNFASTVFSFDYQF